MPEQWPVIIIIYSAANVFLVRYNCPRSFGIFYYENNTVIKKCKIMFGLGPDSL